MTRRAVVGWSLGITALVAALYLPFLGVPFEYDDKVEIVAVENGFTKVRKRKDGGDAEDEATEGWVRSR